MTGQQMITKLRYRLDDMVGMGTDRLWTDAELLDYITSVQHEVAEECRVIHDDESDFCTIDLVAGDSTVALDESLVELEQAVLLYGGQQAPMAIRETLHDFIKAGVWPNPETGIPQAIAPVNSSGKYALDKAIDADAQIRVVVTRLPLAAAALATELEIPKKYQHRLLNGVMNLAFSKPDSETYSAAKADLYKKLYEMDKEWIKRTENKARSKSIKYLVS